MSPAPDKLLLFGGVPKWYLRDWEITSDLPLAEEKLGVRFQPVTNEELLEARDRLSTPARREAAHIARELLDGSSTTARANVHPAPPPAAVEDAARLYLAMRTILRRRRAHAVTIECWHWIQGTGLPVPCLALMLFQESGVPAACQGDIDAYLTMVLLKRVARVPTFMGGGFRVAGHLGISHCVLARNMLGPDAPMQPWTVSSYHGRKDSPTVWTEVPAGGTVTVARFSCGLDRLFLTTGRLLGARSERHRCRNMLVVDVPDRDALLGAVKGFQNHWVVACGDHADALARAARAAGIEPAFL
jgi:L-fucose isomerase-like protein